jgi:prepilin-type N-terminal cleavage/methylation domain-containing protein
MISGIGRRGRDLSGRAQNAAGAARGFTLVEILLVLALLGLVAGAAMLAAGSVLPDAAEDSEKAVWEMITAARSQAVLTGETARLYPGDEGRSLIVPTEKGLLVRTLPAGVTVEIHPPDTADRAGPAGKSAPPMEVGFYRDGTCDGFRLLLRTGRSPVPIVLAVDPWTCAQALPPSAT